MVAVHATPGSRPVFYACMPDLGIMEYGGAIPIVEVMRASKNIKWTGYE